MVRYFKNQKTKINLTIKNSNNLYYKKYYYNNNKYKH